jgi:hypothetical protein
MDMDKQKAIDFFSEFFGGEHHFPSQVKEWGAGYTISFVGELATFDSNNLTTLVLMAHRDAIRVSISYGGVNRLRICIWQRDFDAKEYSRRHPRIDEAIDMFNGKARTP